MASTVEVLFSPAEYQAHRNGGFANSVCVVFDVLRATSVMVTGLANGVTGFVPVEEIPEAIRAKARYLDALLAGERDGLRITAAQSGGVEFDLGNSPHEYSRNRINGRTVISTTTNGTRALRACLSAHTVAIGSFLNLQATTEWLRKLSPERIILVCAGTGEQTALEDAICAGALAHGLTGAILEDSATIARSTYLRAEQNLAAAISISRNARRLLANPELRADIEFCLQRDVYSFTATLDSEGIVRRI